MLIKMVKDLTFELKKVRLELCQKRGELDELRKKHLEFWKRLQKECGEGKTYHCFERKKDNMHSAFVAVFIEKQCPCCLKMLSVGRRQIEKWNLTKVDLDDEATFEKWKEDEHSMWGSESITFEEAKREVEEYFARATPIKNSIAILEKREKELTEPLETIWLLCDKALGKDIERKENEEEIAEGYRKRINFLESERRRAHMPYGDPDAFWD